jgi:predicted ATPase
MAKSFPNSDGFLRSVALQRETVSSFDEYPFSIPAVATLEVMSFNPAVTFFVGENGSGKSTLLEAIAQLAGFNAEGAVLRTFHSPLEERSPNLSTTCASRGIR